MKRYLKYILLALISVALAVSCIEELEPTPSMTANDEVAVLVPRIKSFTNQYVTRSDYSEAEMTISSLKVLVFNNDGRLVRHDDIPVDTRTISLNKSMLNSSANGELTNATVVMLANMDLSRLKKGNTPLSSNLSNLQLSDLENYSYSHEQSVYTSLPSGFKGFPMIGGTTGVDLSPTSTSNQQAPVIVDLKILYAKVNFQISVEQGGENQRVDPSNTQLMQFQLDKYAVYNASAVTALAIPTTEGEPVRDFLGNIPNAENIASVDEPTLSSTYSYTSDPGASLNISKTVALGGASIPFTFYIAESRYNHNLNLESLKEIYPDREWLTSAENDDVKGWDTLTEDQKKLPQNKLNGVKYLYDDLIQQYKPKLANVGGGLPGPGLASFVRLTGKYTDYRGTVWNVNYDVYLGKDNSQNFHVDRNSEYTNIITIKGLRNNDSYGEEQVWFDHRVGVSLGSGQGADDCVTITRETLLDAHIEVRPLRFKFKEGAYDRVNLYLPTASDNQLLNWIGIEKFTGANLQDESIYSFDKNKVSTGKRKYFTTGLIKELQEAGGELGVKTDDQGRKYLDFHEGYTAWIYFDENKSTSSRDAVIRLEFYKNDKVDVLEEYTIRQSGLQKINGTDYIVESYEEYLHSYDSADKYNLSTSHLDYTQQGLPWGLEDRLISKDIIVSAAPIVQLPVIGYPQEMIEQRYDYYHKSDVPSGNTYYQYIKDGNNSWIDIAYGTGLTFTDRASSNEDITIKDMGTVPVNAYQYCLSKNKFNEENNTLDIHWYLPDPYELEAVLTASQGITDFGAEAYYWSSQPSKRGLGLENISGLGNINIIDEVISDAIAVSSQGPSDISRTKQNRIRCFYSEDGIKDVNMANRVPDGLGGNYSFIMKGKPDDGYFNYIVKAIEESDDKGEKPSPTFEDYAYPTFSNPGDGDPSPFGYFNNAIDKFDQVVEGFAKNPLDSKNWAPYDKWEIIATNTYYKHLYVFPGLSPYTLINDGQTGARPSGTERSKTITTSTKFEKKQSLELQNTTMNPLSPRLEIRFDSSNLNTSHEPQFVYSEITDGSFETTEVHKWQVPTYTKSSYTPKADIDYVRNLTVTGTGTVNGLFWSGDTSKAEEDAKTQALENAENQARSQFPNRIYEPEEGYQLTVTGSWNRYGTTYTATATFKGGIECRTSPDPVPYYADAKNGGWNLSSSNTVSLAKVETDELRIYPGNSFTITCTDPDYEITKVRINYKDGTNMLHEPTGLDDLSTHTSRFIDSALVPYMSSITNSADVIGMEYDESKQWQQWTGLGRQVVSLTLVDYQLIPQFPEINLSNFREILELIGKFIAGDWGAITNYDISYQKPANTYLSIPMVVESIDVKCVKKKTTEETTE